MKTSIFKNRWLPYVLIAPQFLVVLVFFFWPAFDSLRLSVFQVTPFGDQQIFVGLDNFIDLITSPEYYRSVYHRPTGSRERSVCWPVLRLRLGKRSSICPSFNKAACREGQS